MKNIISIALIFVSVSIFSQDKVEIINGEESIVHSIKKGETLYGITKKYNTTKKELRSNNSGLLLFIKAGQEIKIPVAKENRTLHTVIKGETLYGIAKQYDLSIDKLVLLNPKKAGNIKQGDILKLKKSAKEPVYEKVKVGGQNKAKVEVKKDVKPILESKPKVEEKIKLQNNSEVHVVTSGETLYSIARKYKISVAELKKLNPGISESLAIGDKVNVPKGVKLNDLEPASLPKKIIQVEYKVEKGETLYGISKKFNTTVEEIAKSNPNITTLKEGDVLKINVPEKGVNEIKIDLGNPNTLDRANFDEVNKINPLKDKLNEMVKKETYTISMFLPLMLDENDQTPAQPNKPKRINPDTQKSTHFYQGAKIALDSVKYSGVSFDLNVMDTEKDTNTVGKYLRTKKVKSSDLIIGPFFEKPYKQIAAYSKLNKVQVVSPRYQGNKVLFNNMYVTELQTSLPIQLEYLSNFLAENKNTQNVICVSGTSKRDTFLYSLFFKKYNSLIASKTNNYRSKASTYKMTSFSSMHGFDEKLVKGKKNIIVLPFTQEGVAISFFTQLNIIMTRSRMKGYEVEIYALENFMNYNEINVDLKMKYNLHVTSSSFINYKDENVKSFVRKYRSKYGTEPSKYAFIGFDIAFYHAIAMTNYGKNFTSYYNHLKVPLLQTSYDLKQTDIGSGYANQAVYILQYKDYELNKVN